MKARFIADIRSVATRPGGRRFILTETVVFYGVKGGRDFDNGFLAYCGRTGIVICRTGYSWDGASIPKWVFWLRRTSKTKVPSLAHDAMYQLGRNGVYANIPDARAQIDAQFYWDLMSHGNGKAKSWQMWRGVRIGGASSFAA